jgi:hypothetical protein
MNIEEKAKPVVNAMLAASTSIRKIERLPVAFVCKPYLEMAIIKLLQNSPPNILVYASPHQEQEICIFYDARLLQEHLNRLNSYNSATFGPRCLECSHPLTTADPPETDKCKSCYEDYER